MEIAKELGLHPEETQLKVSELAKFSEAGAMGTAAVISPVGSLTYQDKKHVFYSETEPGPVTKKLYDALVGIQLGDRPAPPQGWVQEVVAAKVR